MPYYIAPTAAGYTSQRFGTRPGGLNPRGGHTAEDIAVPVGTPLAAMADGIVVHAGWHKGNYWDNPWLLVPEWSGYVVSIEYYGGQMVSHYAHCSGSPVRAGDRVKQGQTAAWSGDTGSASTGPHVHWETMPDRWLINNGTLGRVDPRSYTEAGAALAPAGTLKEIAAMAMDPSTVVESKDGSRVTVLQLWNSLDEKISAMSNDFRPQFDQIRDDIARDRRAEVDYRGEFDKIRARDADLVKQLAGIAETLQARA